MPMGSLARNGHAVSSTAATTSASHSLGLNMRSSAIKDAAQRLTVNWRRESFLSQHRRGVKSDEAARRRNAGRAGHQRNEQRGAPERYRIGRTDVERQRSDERRREERQ